MGGRKLGRGLDLLIRKPAEPPPPLPEETPRVAEAGSGAAVESDEFQLVSVDPRAVRANPDQPRKQFDEEELEALKASISQDGILQPLVLRRVDDSYELIAGERRLRAALELDLQRVPAMLTDFDDDRLLELALVENIQRQDLNPIEVAKAYAQLMATKNWTQEALARSLGLSRSSVANSLRVLDLPEDMQVSLAKSQISPGHAKVLLSIDEEEPRRELFERIAEERLTVRELEEARDAAPQPAPAGVEASVPPSSHRPRPQKRRADLRRLEEEMSEAIGTKVSIQERRGGRGKVTVEFYSADDFARIRERLTGSD